MLVPGVEGKLGKSRLSTPSRHEVLFLSCLETPTLLQSVGGGLSCPEKGGGEVAIPTYEAMQENGISARMLDVLMRGISTRQYAEGLPEMAWSCGVSRSNVSREAAEAGEAALQELLEWRFEEIDLLLIYVDGMQLGEHHIISAVAVDRAGHKYVLGIQQGATENAAAVEDLLQQLVARGVTRRRSACFVIDGAMALRAAINRIFGAQHPVQRCRNHKIRNVCDRLPEEQKDQVKRRRCGLIQTGSEGRHGAIAQVGRLVGAGIAGGGQQFAGRVGRMFHHQSPGHPAIVASLLGHDERDRKPAIGVRMRTRRACAGTMRPWWSAGCRHPAGDGEELPPHHGLQRSLASGSDLRKKRKSCGSTGGRVK